LNNQHFSQVDWNRLLFHYQLKFYVNHVFGDTSHFHQLHLNQILIFNASRNQHCWEVDWNRLLFHHQLKYYANHVFRDGSHFHQFHLNQILIFNASRNQHFGWVDWNRLLFHHQLTFYANHVLELSRTFVSYIQYLFEDRPNWIKSISRVFNISSSFRTCFTGISRAHELPACCSDVTNWHLAECALVNAAITSISGWHFNSVARLGCKSRSQNSWFPNSDSLRSQHRQVWFSERSGQVWETSIVWTISTCAGHADENA
jgi:hypothetical protein